MLLRASLILTAIGVPSSVSVHPIRPPLHPAVEAVSNFLTTFANEYDANARLRDSLQLVQGGETFGRGPAVQIAYGMKGTADVLNAVTAVTTPWNAADRVVRARSLNILVNRLFMYAPHLQEVAELRPALTQLYRAIAAGNADSAVWARRAQTVTGRVLIDEATRLGNPHRYDPFLLSEERSVRGQALVHLGDVLLADHDTTSAITAWETALTMVRNPGPAAYQLAVVAEQRGDAVRAAQYAARAYVTTYRDTLSWKIFDRHAAALLGTNTPATRAHYLDSLENALAHRFEIPPITKATAITPGHRPVVVMVATAPNCTGCRTRDLLGNAIAERYQDGSVIFLNLIRWAPLGARGTEPHSFSPHALADFLPPFAPFLVQPTSELWINGEIIREDDLPGDRKHESLMFIDRRLADIDRERTNEEWQSPLEVTASQTADAVHATITFPDWPKAKGQVIRVVLAEDSVPFTGNNDVRQQPMVVRAWAGDSAHAYTYRYDDIVRQHSAVNAPVPLEVTFNFATLTRELNDLNNAAIAAGGTIQVDVTDPTVLPIPPEKLWIDHEMTAEYASHYYAPAYRLNRKQLYIVAMAVDPESGHIIRGTIVHVPSRFRE